MIRLVQETVSMVSPQKCMNPPTLARVSTTHIRTWWEQKEKLFLNVGLIFKIKIANVWWLKKTEWKCRTHRSQPVQSYAIVNSFSHSGKMWNKCLKIKIKPDAELIFQQAECCSVLTFKNLASWRTCFKFFGSSRSNILPREGLAAERTAKERPRGKVTGGEIQSQEQTGRAGGLPSDPILTGLSRTQINGGNNFNNQAKCGVIFSRQRQR